MEQINRIVCLDGYTLNPGDISWDPFKNLADFTCFDRSPSAQVTLERAQGAQALLSNKTPIDENIMQQLPELKYIGVLATGCNVIDVDAARKRNITVTNVPSYGSDSVAQHSIALLLELIRPIKIHSDAVHAGEWSSNPDWCFTKTPILSVEGLTLGLIGLGSIGLATANIAKAMGMNIICAKRSELNEEAIRLGVTKKSIDEVFAESDAISLHCPLTNETNQLVNKSRLASMKQSAYLINTGRGQLIDNEALASSLKSGSIAGAAVDVLEQEPPPLDHPLIGCPNCIITPHIAWISRSARERLMKLAAENLSAFMQGKALNVVN